MPSDIVSVVETAEKPVLIFAHPASGTKWLQQQLQTVCRGEVIHENLFRTNPRDVDAVVSFRYWKPRTMEKFATNLALTRDPLKVIRSSIPLFRQQTIKSSILMELYADSVPRGSAWVALQKVPEHMLPLYTLMRWYERAELSMPDLSQWYRIEDVAERVKAPPNSKAAGSGVDPVSWDEVCQVGGLSMVKLLEYAKTHGYDISHRELGGVIGCSSIALWK